MIAWIATLSLRLKLIGLAIGSAAIAFLVLYARFRMAKAQAASAKSQAQALEAARKTEKSIAQKRLELSIKQRQIREEIAAKTSRDHFEDQGWGP